MERILELAKAYLAAEESLRAASARINPTPTIDQTINALNEELAEVVEVSDVQAELGNDLARAVIRLMEPGWSPAREVLRRVQASPTVQSTAAPMTSPITAEEAAQLPYPLVDMPLRDHEAWVSKYGECTPYMMGVYHHEANGDVICLQHDGVYRWVMVAGAQVRNGAIAQAVDEERRTR